MHIANCVVTYVAGFVSAILFLRLLIARQRRKRAKSRDGRRRKRASKKVRIDTFVKAATTAVLIHGLAITEIVAPLCLYMGTNCIMNIFEKNKLSFSEPIQMQKVWEVHEDMEDETGGNAAG